MTLTALTKDEGLDSLFDDDGACQADQFSRAINVWIGCQAARDITVNEVALSFNATPDVIREAVELHPWLCLIGDIIEADGL